MIPKRIIQTARTRKLPLSLEAAVAALRLHNPDFEYVFFDDAAARDFIGDHFPHYAAVFDSFPYPIQRVDFFRYLAVYQFGGFYFDTDVLLARGLESLLDAECVFGFERLTWSDVLRRKYKIDWELGNYAFGAAAGHPFLGAIIEDCVRAQRGATWLPEILSPFPACLRDEFEVIYSTGPGAVTRTFASDAGHRKSVRILFPPDVCNKAEGWNRFGDYGVHLGASSWRRPGNPVSRWRVNYHARRNEEKALAFTRRLLASGPVKPAEDDGSGLWTSSFLAAAELTA